MSGRGRTWSLVAFLLGVVVSIAANVAHTWYPTSAPHAVQPPAGAMIAAGFYPLALLLTIEILSRVEWPTGGQWAAARYGGVGLVAVVAAVVSYRHMAGLLAVYGEDAVTATIGPLAVDGLMVVASFGLLAAAAAGHVAAVADETREADEAEAAARLEIGRTVVTDDMRAWARARLIAQPGLPGAELGRLLSVSERTGLRLKNEIEAELSEAAIAAEIDSFAKKSEVTAPQSGP